MAPTTTVIDAGKDLPDNHTPTFAKEPKIRPRSFERGLCVNIPNFL